MDEVPEIRRCLNCESELCQESRYCKHCGQKVGPRRSSVRELATEFLHSISQVDGKFLLTLRHLLLNPGFLTRQYLSGKKARYLRPITITTLLAGIFFLLLESNASRVPASFSDLGLEDGEVVPLNIGPGMSIKLAGADFKDLADSTYEERVAIIQAKAGKPPTATELFFGERALRLIADGGLVRFQQNLLRMASRALVLLIPAFAWLTFVLVWKRKRADRPYYSETLVYSLHVHSYLFALGSVTQLPFGPLWNQATVIGSALLYCGYVAGSLKRSFGGTWLGNGFRSILLILLHVILIVTVATIASLLVLALI
ncbi:MAG: DUF3667 domain-containing protein [Planctomycetota bacterium]